jgi:flagellin
MKLLDGSQSGGTVGTTDAGPRFGVYDTNLQAFVTSDLQSVSVSINTGVKTGGESAIWGTGGTQLILNLQEGKTYSQADIDALIAGAKQEDSTAAGHVPNVSVKFNTGVYTARGQVTGASVVKGVMASSGDQALNLGGATQYVGANTISIKANKFGTDCNVTIKISFDATAKDEGATLKTAAGYETTGELKTTASYEIKLMTGKEYSAQDIQDMLAKAGFSATVEFKAAAPDAKDTIFATDSTVSVAFKLSGGAGLGDDDAYLGQEKYGVSSGGNGITLQIGANEGQTMTFSIDDMSARALGVDGTKVDLSDQENAKKAMTTIDAAIKKVSAQRSQLGAVQNRLEHTISNLDTAAENTQNAESNLRDTDMAKEMVEFSKNNILAQAGQSMLAQANQSNQGVLSLLG